MDNIKNFSFLEGNLSKIIYASIIKIFSGVEYVF